MRINCVQYSQEWWLARKGRFTASDALTIKIAGAGLETLCWEKAAEKIMTDEQYIALLQRRKSSLIMDFGSAQEGFSRDWLSAKLGKFIEDGGIEVFDDNTSFSADGFIEGVAGLEIKNHEPKIGLRMFHKIQKGLRGHLPWAELLDKEHYAQVQFSLWKKPEFPWTFAMGSDCWGDALRYWEIPANKDYQSEIAAGVKKGNDRVEEIVLELLELQNEYDGGKHDSTSNT